MEDLAVIETVTYNGVQMPEEQVNSFRLNAYMEGDMTRTHKYYRHKLTHEERTQTDYYGQCVGRVFARYRSLETSKTKFVQTGSGFVVSPHLVLTAHQNVLPSLMHENQVLHLEKVIFTLSFEAERKLDFGFSYGPKVDVIILPKFVDSLQEELQQQNDFVLLYCASPFANFAIPSICAHENIFVMGYPNRMSHDEFVKTYFEKTNIPAKEQEDLYLGLEYKCGFNFQKRMMCTGKIEQPLGMLMTHSCKPLKVFRVDWLPLALVDANCCAPNFHWFTFNWYQ